MSTLAKIRGGPGGAGGAGGALAGAGVNRASGPDGGPVRVLVVDDDPIVAESLAEFLAGEGYEPATALNGREALETLEAGERSPAPGVPARPFAVVITDVAMPALDGFGLLRAVVQNHPRTVVLMLTGYGTIESAVEAVRAGAADYLTKPVVDAELRMSLERALRQQALQAENTALKQQLSGRFGLDSIVGSEERMLRIYDLVEAVAPTRTTVLMTGESGTGKSMIARAIHQHSSRASKAFVELACGSIPETLLESELFGHVKGAFTGAHADKQGKFLAASGGTIFLDEINSASPAMQLKLLRVLQEKRFEPVGSNQTIEVDVRVILASNQPLEHLVASGAFRQDLYYRINVVKIELPPLRERVSDIPLLAEHFLARHAAELGKVVTGLAPEALDALRRYPFPGNVRELSNILERAAVLARTPTVQAGDLPPHVLDPEAARRLWGPMTTARPAGSGPQGAPALPGAFSPGSIAPTNAAGTAPPPGAFASPAGPTTASAMPPIASAEPSLDEAMKEPERQIILAALKAAGGNKLRAAQALKINRTTLYKKMAALGIDKGQV